MFLTAIMSASKVILIDNDTLMHQLWALSCKKKGLDFYAFFTVDEFLTSEHKTDLSCEVYIDFDLGNGLTGDQESKKLFDLGFESIILATGHHPSEIHQPQWIKKIIGKRPPF